MQTPDHNTLSAVRPFDAAGYVELAREPTTYELLRVPVPKDSVGVVTLLWQYLQSPLGPLTGPLDHQQLGAGVSVRWALVREDTTSVPDELRRLAGGAEPPTSRIAPYGSFSDLRHPWGNAVPLRALVPEHSILSFWIQVTAPAGELRTAGARIVGYTQPASLQLGKNLQAGL